MSARGGRLILTLAIAGASAAWWTGVDPRLAMRLDAKTSEAVAAIVDAARQEGIPTEPLINRALEGASKRAAGDVIVAVVRSWVGDLRRARQALGTSATEAEIDAGAKALRAGVRVQELQRLGQAKAGVRYAMALDVMSYVINRGVPPDTAARVVVSLVLASATDEQLTTLRADIERDIVGGTPAALAASARGMGLERVIAVAAATNNGGAPGAALPSGRGSIGGGGLPVNSVAGSVQGNAATGVAPGDGSRAPAPRGKPRKP